MAQDIDNTRELAEKLLDWNQHKVAHLRSVADQAKAGTTFVVGDAEVEATSREALFFRLGVEAALTEIGTLPIKLTPQKPMRKRAT
jgi:hypothetical protein